MVVGLIIIRMEMCMRVVLLVDWKRDVEFISILLGMCIRVVIRKIWKMVRGNLCLPMGIFMLESFRGISFMGRGNIFLLRRKLSLDGGSMGRLLKVPEMMVLGQIEIKLYSNRNKLFKSQTAKLIITWEVTLLAIFLHHCHNFNLKEASVLLTVVNLVIWALYRSKKRQTWFR